MRTKNISYSQLIDEQIKFELNKCVHWNGFKNQACQVGIVYDEILGKIIPNIRRSSPCYDGEKSLVKCSEYKQKYTPESAREMLRNRKDIYNISDPSISHLLTSDGTLIYP